MTKGNPLFVDSTKLQTDSIGVNIELTKLFLRDGESAFIKVTNEKGQVNRTALKYSEQDNLAQGQLWLFHQQKISYQFYIIKGEEVLFTTDLLESRASYILQHEWQPCFKMASKEKVKRAAVSKKPKNKIKTQTKSNESVSKGVERVSSIMAKWGF